MPGNPKTIKVFSKKHNNQQVIINESDFNGIIHSIEPIKVEEVKQKPRQTKPRKQE